MSADATVTLRRARAADAIAIKRVAQRDCAPVPHGDVFVAERDGRILAWVEHASGRIAADPFHPTADLVALLEVRRAQLATARPAEARPRGVVFFTGRRRRTAAATTG